MMNIRACIFDLDGTVFDSLHIWSKIDVDFLSKRGISVPDDYCEKIGAMRLKDIAEYTILRFSLDEKPEEIIAEWKEMAINAYATEIGTKPFALEYLTALRKRGIKTAVATTNSEELYIPALTHNNILHLFDVIVDGTMVFTGKSEPDIYLAAAEKLGFSPPECMVFEDIPAGIKCAKEAGFHVTAIVEPKKSGTPEQIIPFCYDCISDFEKPLQELNQLEKQNTKNHGIT